MSIKARNELKGAKQAMAIFLQAEDEGQAMLALGAAISRLGMALESVLDEREAGAKPEYDFNKKFN